MGQCGHRIDKVRSAARFAALVWAGLCLFVPASFAQSSEAALLSVQANGLAPGQIVTLATGPKQTLSAKADLQGGAVFNNLKYAPTGNLAFTLNFQVQPLSGRGFIPNALSLDMDPFTGSVQVKGNATRAASIVMNLSSEDSKAMIANQKGYFEGIVYSTSGLDTGQVRLLASIVNVQENCCPRSFQPFPAVTIRVQSVPQRKASSDILKTYEVVSTSKTIEGRFGVSVPSETIEQSWLKGFRNFGNRITTALISQTTSLGSFMNAQTLSEAKAAREANLARTAKAYATSEALCRFGTLSQSLAASEALKNTNKLIINSVLNNRERAPVGTANADPINAVQTRINQMANTYCDPTQGNVSLGRLCEDSKDSSRFNKDVNYTRGLDVPMTLDIAFSETGTSGQPKDQQDILALSETLFPSQPLARSYSNSEYLTEASKYRSLQAMRNVAKTSLVTTIAEKAKGTKGSEEFISKLMQALGVPEAQAKQMMGENPSYFAQMEVLTKKLYQDPAFYVNLVDTPANVQRQRAAIRAIKLQQGHDLAETVKRREMLLAILLELKIRERAAVVDGQTLNGNDN